jgi:signal transduction histidine kinase
MSGGAETCRREYEFDQGEHQQWFVALATRFQIGGTRHIVLMHLDVTAQKRMEVQLQQAQKLESIGQLAAGIAHEINTPIQFIGDNLTFLLGAFRSVIDLLEPFQALLEQQGQGGRGPESVSAVRQALDQADPEFLKEDVPKAIQQSLDGVSRVAKIVNAMKEFSHPGSATRTPFDLNHAIESTALVCHNEWKYVAEMEFDFDPRLHSVPCFPDQFNQVMLNLIINAAHAIGDSLAETPGGKGRIRIRTRVLEDVAEIRVEDTGTGIPEAIRSRIFDPFFTTKPLGKGTGQGLAIAYSVIVEQHGGTISVASDPGKGATFILRLPLDDVSARPN